MPLVHNERWKLTATALNGIAIGTAVTGFIAPIVAVTYGVSGTQASAYLIAVSGAWFLAAIALHLFARAILVRLRE